jgi:succinyl-diaminopimelate desuccinylase
MSDSTERQAVESLATDLIEIETENPPGNEQPCAEYIVDWFAERDIDARLVEEPDPERPQTVARVGDGSPTLVLNGHMDVVPAGNRSEWTHDPYGAEIEDDKLYGRGSVDMKAGLAIAMLTAVALRDPIESGAIDGSLVVQAAIGEETGDLGTRTLLEAGYDGDYGVVLEPTNMQTTTSVKGLVWYDIVVQGTPCHASQPDAGTNAITNARPVLDALEAYDERVRERRDDLVGQAYATITGMAAGVESNSAVLPDDATITLDRRVLPDESVDEIDEEIDATLSRVAREHDITVGWERTMTCESASVPIDCRLSRVFREHSASVADVPDEAHGTGITTDTRNLVNDAGMEAITWGPGDIAQAHTRDEHVDLDEVTTGLEILKSASRAILSE